MISISLETRKTSAGRRYYYLICYDKNRSPKRKAIATGTTHKSVAEKQRRALQDAIARGESDPWAEQKPPKNLQDAVLAFVEDAQSRGLRPKTIQVYTHVCKQFLEHAGASTMVPSIDPTVVRSFCVQPHLSEASRAHRLRHIRVFFSWAVKAGLIDANPTTDIGIPRPKKKVQKLITEADLDRILTAISFDLDQPSHLSLEERAGYWLTPMIQTAFYCGLRRGEAIRLRWEDVNLEAGLLIIRGSKGGDRVVPIPAILRPVLETWQAATKTEGLVFETRRGGQLNGDYVGRTFARYAKLAGVRVTAFHGLRHGTATALLAKGVSTRVVQQILGHSSVSVTEKYLHVVADLMREQMDQAFR